MFKLETFYFLLAKIFKLYYQICSFLKVLLQFFVRPQMLRHTQTLTFFYSAQRMGSLFLTSAGLKKGYRSEMEGSILFKGVAWLSGMLRWLMLEYMNALLRILWDFLGFQSHFESMVCSLEFFYLINYSGVRFGIIFDIFSRNV